MRNFGRFEEYRTELRRLFAHYGFSYCPLTRSQMSHLFATNVSIDNAYDVGCDVAAGWGFFAAIEANCK